MGQAFSLHSQPGQRSGWGRWYDAGHRADVCWTAGQAQWGRGRDSARRERVV